MTVPTRASVVDRIAEALAFFLGHACSWCLLVASTPHSSAGTISPPPTTSAQRGAGLLTVGHGIHGVARSRGRTASGPSSMDCHRRLAMTDDPMSSYANVHWQLRTTSAGKTADAAPMESAQSTKTPRTDRRQGARPGCQGNEVVITRAHHGPTRVCSSQLCIARPAGNMIMTAAGRGPIGLFDWFCRLVLAENLIHTAHAACWYS
jgi:hypothetical protein